MAIKNLFYGIKDAYHKISAIDIDYDLMSIKFRVEIYEKKGTGKIHDVEHLINKKILQESCIAEAVKQVDKKIDLQKEIDVEVRRINDQREKQGNPLVTIKEREKIKNAIRNRFISKFNKEIAQQKLIDIFKSFEIRIIGYKYLKELEIFKDCKDD